MRVDVLEKRVIHTGLRKSRAVVIEEVVVPASINIMEDAYVLRDFFRGKLA